MGSQLPPEKRTHHPTQFLAHVCCGQTAGWMKTALGTEVDLSPGHVVLDGDPDPPRKGAQQPPPPLFGGCLLWPQLLISATAKLLSLLWERVTWLKIKQSLDYERTRSRIMHIVCFSAHQSSLSSQYSTCCVWGLCAENQFKTAAAWSELKIGFMY